MELLLLELLLLLLDLILEFLVQLLLVFRLLIFTWGSFLRDVRCRGDLEEVAAVGIRFSHLHGIGKSIESLKSGCPVPPR